MKIPSTQHGRGDIMYKHMKTIQTEHIYNYQVITMETMQGTVVDVY